MFHGRRAIARLAKRPAESSDDRAAVRADKPAAKGTPTWRSCSLIARRTQDSEGLEFMSPLWTTERKLECIHVIFDHVFEPQADEIRGCSNQSVSPM